MAKLPFGWVMLAHENRKELKIEIEQQELVLCEDCEFYEVEDHWSEMNGIPVLGASDVPTCKRWGSGCMTKPDGWCFLAEKRKEKADGQ